MNLVSKKWVIALLTRIVIIVIFAKMAALGMLWVLPGEGVEQPKETSVVPSYHRYTFGKPPKQEYVKPSVAASAGRGIQISDMVLRGLYRTKSGGYVIISGKGAGKSELIGIGEVYNGYTLQSINADSAIFMRNGQRYTLGLERSTSGLQTVAPAAPVKASTGGSHEVKREEIDFYSKNIDKIWKDIGIQEVRKGGELNGFKVTRIRPRSPFSKLGLRKGDVIIKANNKPLKSYADAMNIYKNIATLDALELVVLRNNQEKELIYEVH